MADTTIILFSSALIFSFFLTSSTAIDTITANQTIRDDGNGTIESATGAFEMGFFSPGSSKNRYLGIWYKKLATGTVIWVANRETPITDTSGVLRVNLNGVLVLKDGTNSIIWSSNSSGSAMKPVAQLLDTGNLVIRNGNDTYPEDYLWQSFDHPGDNGLAGTKLGWDLGKGLNRRFTSWKSPDDPSPGNYSSGVDLDGYPQHTLWNGSAIRFRFGPWNGIQFGGKSYMMQNPIFTLDFVFDQNEIYYKSELRNSSIAMRMMLNPYGQLQILVWTDPTHGWVVYLNTPTDNCDNYGLCGAFGTCNFTNSKLGFNACGCLEGFEPKYPEKWKAGDWSSGCIRKTKLDCGSRDTFVKLLNLKLPDTRHSWFDPKMSLEECETVCLKNCSCTAYANMDIREGGSGCLLWFDDLMDMRVFIGNDQYLYVRVAAGRPGTTRSSSRAKKAVSIIVVIAVLVVLAVILSLILIIVFKKRKQRRKGKLSFSPSNESTIKSEKEDLQLPLFDFVTIANATNNFSQNNKLGEGGFGPVYMGILDDGQEIAVKRLSKTSNQGLDEFKNEVSCIAKLQHRNLVRLLGCSFEDGEMLLIYEYMPNKSLDFLIFNKELSKSLDWPKRFNIINGITKGLLYLHQDSRLRIIHRDLKASNILLDCEMNPKVSDFGTARSFGGNESEANTSRVVGTFGYMSPEYALDGTFSVKSDVYSFGVLVLEIVSGKKMRGFYHPDPNLNLLGHAWRLRKEGKLLELIDEAIQESCNQSEVFRAIQIGLLCAQPYPEDRPSMSSVNLMLSSEIEMPEPMQPGFFTGTKLPETNSSSPLILDISGVFDTSSLGRVNEIE